MITQEQINHFNTKGYVVVENLLDETTLEAVRSEYSQRMDMLYSKWEKQGLVKPAHKGMTFWDNTAGAMMRLIVHKKPNS